MNELDSITLRANALRRVRESLDGFLGALPAPYEGYDRDGVVEKFAELVAEHFPAGVVGLMLAEALVRLKELETESYR